MQRRKDPKKYFANFQDVIHLIRRRKQKSYAICARRQRPSWPKDDRLSNQPPEYKHGHVIVKIRCAIQLKFLQLVEIAFFARVLIFLNLPLPLSQVSNYTQDPGVYVTTGLMRLRTEIRRCEILSLLFFLLPLSR